MLKIEHQQNFDNEMNNGTTKIMSASKGGEGPVTIIGQKRKIPFKYYVDKTNIYMEDINIRRRRLLGDDESDLSSSSSDSSDDEGSERARKSRKRNRKRRLHWSKTPDKDAKYSDWKIQVKHFSVETSQSMDTGDADGKESQAMKDIFIADDPPKATEVVTYSVHRSTLGVQSEYFERIFLGGYSESTLKKNTIKLPSPLVTFEHFECILEYCYTGAIDLNGGNVVSIINLSDYLDIEELRKKAQAYVRTAIHQVTTNKRRRLLGSSKDKIVLCSSDECKEKSAKVAMMYQAANDMGIDDLQRAIVHVCSKEPELLAKDCKLVDMPDIEFWCRLWEARKVHPDQNSVSKTVVRAWSENLAYFFDKHPGITDLKTFRELTHIDSLKMISPEVAILLMQQEYRLFLDNIEANVYLVDKGDKEDALTCLQTRCIDALYNSKKSGWQITCPPEVIRGNLRKLPSIVLESILLKTMEFERAGQRFPMPLVSGAGSEFVNGVYRMSGWFKNAMKFTRMGVYEGNPRQITIYRYEGEWWISIIPEHHDEPGDCDDIDFYSFESLEDDSESPLPPKEGWITCSGESPAPEIRLLTHDEMENNVENNMVNNAGNNVVNNEENPNPPA